MIEEHHLNCTSEWREVQSSIRVTPMPKLNRELPPRWRSPDSQVATASSVLYLAQSGWVMTPALLMTGSTDVQPVCSRPIVKIRNRIRISTSQTRLSVNWFKVLQKVDVHLIVPLFFQIIVNEKLIYNTNRFVLQELVILLGRCLTVKLKNWSRPFHFSLCQ